MPFVCTQLWDWATWAMDYKPWIICLQGTSTKKQGSPLEPKLSQGPSMKQSKIWTEWMSTFLSITIGYLVPFYQPTAVLSTPYTAPHRFLTLAYMGGATLALFYKWENWDLEGLEAYQNLQELVNKRDRLEIPFSLSQRPACRAHDDILIRTVIF